MFIETEVADLFHFPETDLAAVDALGIHHAA